MKNNSWKKTRQRKYGFAECSASLFFICLCGMFFTSCKEIKSPEPAPFIGKILPPQNREFRWSNGKMPKSFDPAKATAAPETDIVRAVYEGLTELDPKTLKPVPAVAEKWSASEDFKTWTFQLRRDAKWSNGKLVTAEDFVRSWKRLTEMGEKVSRRDLLKNIVGMNTEDVLPVFADESSSPANNNKEVSSQTNINTSTNTNINNVNTVINSPFMPIKNSNVYIAVERKEVKPSAKFGVEAVDDFNLKVSLIHPDKDFPSLVVHPIFRPVYGDGKDLATLNPNIVTNGAFRPVETEKNIVIEPSENYRNREQIKIERIRFVPTDTAESALAAYQAGEIDAVTNADLQPLALKLLTPFKEEFRQIKHGALNFYEFNRNNKPFDDLRVRQALASAIERERLTDGETEGSTEPALGFLPFDEKEKISESAEQAKKLLADAGFPEGRNFPTIRLMINRNDLQKRIARAVAKMWKNVLNIETEVIVKDQADFENALKNGEFDMVRRGVLFPTNNETANMLTIFDSPKTEINVTDENNSSEAQNHSNLKETKNKTETQKLTKPEELKTVQIASPDEKNLILTEAEAIEKMPAIPLYFPTSYALVKPYIKGFEMNELDAPLLKTVTIDESWQAPKSEQTEIK